jgi:hypothetical protein
MARERQVSYAAIGREQFRTVRARLDRLERGLIGGVRRALGRDHTGSRTASYTFGADESGYLGIAIVVRHDLSFSQLLPFGVRITRPPI